MMIVRVAELMEITVGVAEHERVLNRVVVPGDNTSILALDGLKNVVCIGNIEVLMAAVLVEFAEALIILRQEDLLSAQLAQLHALLDQSALPVELGLVVLHPVLDRTVFGFCVGWHLTYECIFFKLNL